MSRKPPDKGRNPWAMAAIAVMLVIIVALVWLAPPRLWRAGWSLVNPYRWWALAVIGTIAVLIIGWLLAARVRLQGRSPWQAYVLAAADSLEHQFAALPDVRMRPAERQLRLNVGQAVHDHLDKARKAAQLDVGRPRPLSRLVGDWWTGAPVEAAYVHLHAAEIALAQVLPAAEIEARIPEAIARLQTMDVTDPRRRAAESELAPTGAQGDRRRAAFHNAVRIGFELTDRQHARVRNFRNIVLAATLVLLNLVIVLCVVGARDPDAIPLCFSPQETTAAGGQTTRQGSVETACPSEEVPPGPGDQLRRLPAPGDVALVALLGLLGGALTTAVAMRKLQGSSTPYGIPVGLGLLKLPSGALSAIIGLLLVRGAFIPGLSQLDNQPQILAYAFLFGIAQHLVTRLVDRQAEDILAKVPSKEPTSNKPEPPPHGHQLQPSQQPKQLRRILPLRR
jgi:hypothetical protein